MAEFRRAFADGAASILSLQAPPLSVQKLRRRQLCVRRDSDNIRGDWERVGHQLVVAAHAVRKQS